MEINSFVQKIIVNQDFRFNVSIVNFYEVYKILINMLTVNNNKTLTEGLIKILKMMIPFTPHIAHECLEKHNCKNKNNWPEIDLGNLTNEIKIAVQINGKTRDIITIKKNLGESEIVKLVQEKSKAKKFLENKKVFKTIFVKNKIINYIIK